jgi:peptidase E
MTGRILALGGHAAGADLDELVLEAAGGPRICFVPTASGDDDGTILRFYDRFGSRAEASHVVFHPWPRPDLREHVLAQDALYVGGGNTANMLAIWRVHGFDTILREAWEAGVLLCGWSAGMICWFEAGVTDSFGPDLAGMRDGLGLLPGSACPHYDGEQRRRPVYTRLVREGFPPGYAADDGVGLLFEGRELREVVTTKAGSSAYCVERDREEPLEARLL